MRSVLLVVLLLSCVPVSGQTREIELGTAIVALAATDGIVVAADSRTTQVSLTGEIVSFDDTACKIRVARPDLLVATTGFVKLPRQRTDDDWTMQGMLSTSAPLSVAVDFFAMMAQAEFTKAPEVLNSLPGGLRIGASPLQVVFVGLVGGKPKLESRTLVVATITPTLEIAIIPVSLTAGDATGKGFGHFEFKPALLTAPDYLTVEAASVAARRLMDLNEKAPEVVASRMVGGPVDVVTMTAAGISSAMKPNCSTTPQRR